MANIKISQLPVLANPVDATKIPVVDSGATKTISASSLATYVSGRIPWASVLPTASTTVLGGVKIDGVTVTINGSGQLVSNFAGGAVTGATTFSSTVNITGNVVSPATAVGNVIAFNYDNQAAFPTASTYHGAILHSHADARMYMSHNGWQPMALLSDITSYSLPTATTTVLGGIKIDGSTITINDSGVISASIGSVYTLPTATTTVLGGVKIDGSTITINGSGVISSAYAYVLPTATTTVLGGVKVDGSTVTINGSGVITANYTTYSLPTATTTVLGGVKVDGSTITINGSGVINANYTTYSLPTATGSVLGGVKVGTGLAIDGAGVLSASASSVPTYGAVTTLVVTTPVFNYNIDQYSGDNPAIYATSGTTIAFSLQVGGSHPFLIQQNNANITTANLIHVSTTGVVSTGSSAQGQISGTLYWKIPASVSGTFRYICQAHSSMVGVITINPTTVTATSLGLGNVTNESKATMFTSPTFTGTVTLQQSTEVLNTKTSATGTVTHDLSTGTVFYHSSISANFTANFTNVPTTNDRTVAVVLVLSQGATAYLPTAVQVAGIAQPIFWQGAVLPSGTASRVDVVSFTLIRTGSVWTVIGSLTTYGAP